MTYNPIVHWDGDRQFSINDIRVNDTMLADPTRVIAATITDALTSGLNVECGAAHGKAAMGNCSRCGKWKRNRRILVFAPSDPQSFGAPPDIAWVFYFTLCPSCTGSMSNAEQREWAEAVAATKATL